MKNRELSSVKAISYLVPLIIRTLPVLTLCYVFLSVALSAQAGLTVYVNQFFYDSLTAFVVEKASINNAVYGAICMISMLVVGQLLGKIYGFVWMHLGDKLEYKLLATLNEKISQIPAQNFEDAVFLAEIDKAQDGIYGAVGMAATLFEVCIYFLGYFTITGFYLWNVHPLLVLSLVVIFIPSLSVILLQSKMYAEEADELIFLRRKVGSYYGAAINHRETRLFGIFGYFYNLVYQTKKEFFSRKRQTEKKFFYIAIALDLIRMIGWCGVVFFMIFELIKGNISVGVFAAVYASVGGMFDNCEALLSRIKIDFVENLGMISDYIAFIKLKNRPNTGVIWNEKEGIRVQNITFKYPGAEFNAVEEISLDIAPGETVAIVGANGSGKSTLAKLLCGLYMPEKGNVIIGGVDSQLLDFKTLFSKSTAVFQNYMKYAGLTLAENVVISKTPTAECDVDKYFRIVDTDFAFHLPDGYNTIMARSFDGIELSGGEWQRVAMARGIHRPHDIILLDEPTAAIDPLEETRIYHLFAQYSKEKTCILITHRLGSVKMADKILVMKSGHIVEQGKHEELLKLGGLYATMWNATVKGYTN